MSALVPPRMVRDALSRLSGWSGDNNGIGATFTLDPAQHAELTERVKVCSDAMRHAPDIERMGDQTRFRLGNSEIGLTDKDIALAARIDAIARSIAPRPDPTRASGTTRMVGYLRNCAAFFPALRPKRDIS